jgi:parallel beta-helix repeat protein
MNVVAIGVWVRGQTNAPIRDVVIRNGMVRNYAIGILLQYVSGVVIEHVVAANHSQNGIDLNAFSSGECRNNRIERCSIIGNSVHGVRMLAGGTGRVINNVIADCIISGNGDSGVYLANGTGNRSGNRIVRSTISENLNAGIWFNGTGGGQLEGNVVSDCTIYGNGNYGIHFNVARGSVIANCVIRRNGTEGIFNESGLGNRIEGNHISEHTSTNSYGLRSAFGDRTLIVRNSADNNTENYLITMNDTYGPIVTDAGALSVTGAASHAWANFSR